jgi:tetratricopeptide (TPR) repeat protein
MTHGEVIRSSGSPALDDAALEVAEHSAYLPAVEDGRAVDRATPMRFTFSLGIGSPSSTDTTQPTSGPPAAEGSAAIARAAVDLLRKGDHEAAIARVDEALAQEPGNAQLLALRGMAHAQARHSAAAHADIDRALQLDPRNEFALRTQGALAMQELRFPQAIAAFSSALALSPGDQVLMRARLDAAIGAGDLTQALAWSTEALKAQAASLELRSRQALLLRALRRPEESAAQAEGLLQAATPDTRALSMAAGIYAASGRPADALRVADQAVTLLPGTGSYLTRASLRPRVDRSGRVADIDAALNLDPSSVPAILERAQLQRLEGDPAAAVDTLNSAIRSHPDDEQLLLQRGIALLKSGHTAAGEADLAAVRQRAQSPVALNNVCWELATADVDLEQARQACESAVSQDPLVYAYLDSLGFVLLRLGLHAQALQAYDRALKAWPLGAVSLYGRGLVHQRLGDRAAAEKDLAEARALDARIAEIFADYGLASQAGG